MPKKATNKTKTTARLTRLLAHVRMVNKEIHREVVRLTASPSKKTA